MWVSRDRDVEIGFGSWVEGYWTGLNTIALIQKRPLPKIAGDAMEAPNLVQAYCEANADITVLEATMAVWAKMRVEHPSE